jgi:hypothetical protein
MSLGNGESWPTTLSFDVGLPYNATIDGSFMIYDSATFGEGAEVDYNSATPITLDGVGTAYSITGLAGTWKNDMYIKFQYIFPNVRDQGGLAPYGGVTKYPFVVKGFAQPLSLTLSWPLAGLTADYTCAANPRQCGSVIWSAGRGLPSTMKAQVYLPIPTGQYDRMTVQGLTGASSITSCSLGGSAITITSNSGSTLRASVPQATNNGEMGYVELSCAATSPMSASGNVSVQFERSYYPNPESNPTYYYRFTTQLSMVSPSAAVIGATTDQNDAIISMLPNSYTPGADYAIVITTNAFNTQLGYTTVSAGDDQGTVYTYPAIMSLAVPLGTNFLTVPDTTAVKCTWTLNQIAPNYNSQANALKVVSSKIDQGLLKLNIRPVDNPIPLSTGAIRIFCNGFKFSTGYQGGTTYLPVDTDGDVLTASLQVFPTQDAGNNSLPSTQNAVGVNDAIPFIALVRDSGGTPVDWVFHNLVFVTDQLLDEEQIAQVLAKYKSVLKLNAAAVSRVSTQVYDPKAKVLRVTVAIRGGSTQPSSDIRNLLNASAATSIANDLAKSFSFSSVASQSPSSLETVPGHCNNQQQDSDMEETGVDCGGKCLGCLSANQVCVVGTDCASGQCTQQKCIFSSNNSVIISASVATIFAIFAVVVVVV